MIHLIRKIQKHKLSRNNPAAEPLLIAFPSVRGTKVP
jgi:hypothetical protein